MRAPPFLLFAVIFAASADDRVGGSASITSDYRLDGLSQSNSGPALQGEIHFRSNPDGRSSWYAGIWASTVKLSDDAPTSVQLEPFLGYGWAFDADWQGKLALSHYVHPWNSRLGRYDYDELTAGIAYRDALSLSVAYTPNLDLYSRYGFAENRASFAYELGGKLPVRRAFSVTGGVGYRDLNNLFGTGYWYGSAGMTYDGPRLHASFLRIETDHTTRHLFYGDSARPTWVGTLLWTY